MAEKLYKETDKTSFYEKQEGSGEQKYCEVTKRVKKDNVTRENIGEIMLTQIPGISSTSAIAIMDKYSTISNLINSLEDSGLADIIVGKNRHGQVGTVNLTYRKEIVQFVNYTPVEYAEDEMLDSQSSYH